LTKARADIAEMEVERLAGTLVDVLSVENAWTAAGTRFRQKVLSIPHKAAPVLAAEEDIDTCCAILEEHVHDALRELSNLDVDVDGEEPTTEADAEASEINISTTETQH
jgi:phage terminase Nu1 subunit (DNA packaging protein)